MAKERIWNKSLDIIKTVAIITVLMTHISASFVILFPVSSPEFIWGNIIDSLSRIGVPLFVMVSGALFLDEDKPFDAKSFFRKHLLKMVVLLVIWSIVYGIFYSMVSGVGILDYIFNFAGTLYPHIWYMYMIIGLYLITPVLRLFVKRENSKYILYFIILSVCGNFIPSFLGIFKNIFGFTVANYSSRLYLNFASGYTTYFLLGWYITNVDIKKKAKNILIGLGGMGLILMIVLTQAFESSIPASYQFTYDSLSILPFVYSLGSFLLLYRKENTQKNRRAFRFISKYTFGIYMLHIIFLEIFMNYILPYSPSTFITPLLYMVLLFVEIGAPSVIFSYLIEKVPYVRKLLYL